MKVRVLAPALQEIIDATLWFDRQRMGLGDEFYQSADATFHRIADNPLAFSKSEFATIEYDFRFAVIRRFTYVVHFLIGTTEVQIVAVAHGARRPGHWLRRAKREPKS